MACAAPDPSYGTVIRLGSYLDCQGETLGSDGFLGLAGYTVSNGLLFSLVTILIALIGYRFLTGNQPDVGDGLGWAVRIGLVLALLTAWPAFQALFYDIAISGPEEISESVLTASAISHDQVPVRLQRAYDTIRLGIGGGYGVSGDPGNDADGASALQFLPPMEKTAVAFLVATVGLLGAAKIAAGFLLAIAPLPILALMFASAYGLFIGWLRTLAATLFATIGLIISTSLHLVVIEAELSRLQRYVGFASNTLDADHSAIVAIVLIFGLISVALIFVSSHVSNAIAAHLLPFAWRVKREAAGHVGKSNSRPARAHSAGEADLTSRAANIDRAAAFRETLTHVVRREQFALTSLSVADGAAGANVVVENRVSQNGPQSGIQLNRALGRRHRSSTRRDLGA